MARANNFDWISTPCHLISFNQFLKNTVKLLET